MTILLNNVSTDVISSTFRPLGGSFVFLLAATSFGTATVNFQVAAPSDSPPRWITLDNGSFTASASQKIEYLPNGILFRAEVTGANGGTDSIFLEIIQ